MILRIASIDRFDQQQRNLNSDKWNRLDAIRISFHKEQTVIHVCCFLVAYFYVYATFDGVTVERTHNISNYLSFYSTIAITFHAVIVHGFDKGVVMKYS